MTTTEETTQTLEAERMDRIRKLLAKAEASQYPEEAETFMTKVSELIARWGVDEAVLWAEASPESRAVPVERTITLTAPYVARKAVLVNTVVTACGCECVRMVGSNPRVTVIGFEGDVRRAEVLVTSLMMQLTRDMLNNSPQGMTANQTASWRRSFIIGFANRIGARLNAARSDAARGSTAGGTSSQHVNSGGRTSTEIALLDRAAEVKAAMKQKFPHTRTTYISAGSSTSGRKAGDESASRADLGGRNLSGARGELGA